MQRLPSTAIIFIPPHQWPNLGSLQRTASRTFRVVEGPAKEVPLSVRTHWTLGRREEGRRTVKEKKKRRVKSAVQEVYLNVPTSRAPFKQYFAPKEQKTETSPIIKIYWNIDRSLRTKYTLLTLARFKPDNFTAQEMCYTRMI